MADESFDDLFGADEPVEATPVAEVVQETPSEAQEAPVVEDDAAPASEEPKADVVLEAPAQEPAAAEPTVPVSVLTATRKELGDRIKALEEAAKPKQPDPEPEVIPDPKTDLEGYLAWHQGQQAVLMVNQTLTFSEKLARKEHGAELIDKVKEWTLARFETDPSFAQKVLLDADPYEVALSEYNTAQLALVAGDAKSSDWQEFLAWKQGKNPADPATPKPAAQAVPATAFTPPASIVGESSAAGAHSGKGTTEAFDDAFPD